MFYHIKLNIMTIVAAHLALFHLHPFLHSNHLHWLPRKSAHCWNVCSFRVVYSFRRRLRCVGLDALMSAHLVRSLFTKTMGHVMYRNYVPELCQTFAMLPALSTVSLKPLSTFLNVESIVFVIGLAYRCKHAQHST